MGLYTHCCLGLLLVGLLLRGAEADCCHMEWLPSRGYCCKLFGDELSWADAELACQNRMPSSHLASILSNAESAELAKYIVKYRKDGGHVWIGLCAPRQNRVRRGADRSSTGYMAWKDGEPNNQRNEENYVELSSPSGLQPEVKSIAGCPTDAYSYQDGGQWYCFQFFKNTMGFDEAEAVCLQQGIDGHLASIKNGRETNLLGDYVTQRNVGMDHVWIGLHRDADSDLHKGWQWIDGTFFDYTYWAPGEPNNVGKREYCVVLAPETGNKQWRDCNCDVTRPFLCKWRAS